MRTSSSRRRWMLILLVVLLALASLMRPLVGGGEATHLGLDLDGGVELRYELPEIADLPQGEAAEALDSTRRILRRRLDAHGVKEISVRTLGTDCIEIAIPGISPRETEAYKRALGSKGRLEFLIEADATDGVDVEAERRALREELARDGQLVGILAGTFSTIYVATPALLFFTRWSERREARARTLAAHLP